MLLNLEISLICLSACAMCWGIYKNVSLDKGFDWGLGILTIFAICQLKVPFSLVPVYSIEYYLLTLVTASIAGIRFWALYSAEEPYLWTKRAVFGIPFLADLAVIIHLHMMWIGVI